MSDNPAVTPTPAAAWAPLTTERLCLRAPRASDAGPITLFAGDARVARMTTSIPHPYLPDMARAFLDAIDRGQWGEAVWSMDATSSGGAEFAGLISYKPRVREIGYWVGPPFWNTGLATEAVRAVSAHLETASPGPLDATLFADNPASERVLGHAGFQPVGALMLYSVARGTEVPAIRLRRG